jgi:hypothetical protein
MDSAISKRNGSQMASSCSARSSSLSSPARLPRIRSVAPAAIGSSPASRHTSWLRSSAPESTPERTNSRSKSALPAARRTSNRGTRSSTSPPRTISSSARTSPSANGARGRWVHSPSAHSRATRSGTRVPERTVATTSASPPPATRHNNSDDSSSSRCASSTRSTVGLEESGRHRDRPTRRNSFAPSVVAACASAGKEKPTRALHNTSSVCHPPAPSRRRTSRASMVLPTPASPTTTAPTPRRRSARIEAISLSRPMIGQVGTTF